MKKYMVLSLILALLFVGCGCGGGGGVGVGAGDYDLAGTWEWTQTVTDMICDWAVTETRWGELAINQNGTQLVVRSDYGELYEGIINSNTVYLESFVQGVTLTFTGTVIDDSRVEGSSLAVTNGCRLELTEVWTRISHELLF